MGRTSLRVTVAAAAALAAAAAPATPVAANGASHTISASPSNPMPDDTVTVTGTSTCAEAAYSLTLTYTAPDDNTRTVTANGTSDAEGSYTQAIAVPETATAGEPASVHSLFADCSDQGAAASNTVSLAVTAHDGTFTIDPAQGPAGTTVQFSGTNCWGADIVVVFTDAEFAASVEVEDVTLNEDRTFTGSFVVPDEAGASDYFFVAECPGTDFPEQAFAVTASPQPGPGPEPGPGPQPGPGPVPGSPLTPPVAAPPATPVVGQPRFTG